MIYRVLPATGATPHLDSKATAYTLDTIYNIYRLINTDDVWVCCCHALQQSTAAADVEDDGQVGVCLLHTVNHLLDVRTARCEGVQDRGTLAVSGFA